MSDPWLGKVINGKFRILAAIGKGGMGKVYRAEQLPLGRTVAVKVLHRRLLDADQDSDPQFQRRFFLEASLCSKVSHPNVVTIYDYGRIDDQEEEAFFMAMEFLEGQTLHERLRFRETLPPREAIAVVLDLARGLREAHRHGLVHRDLKPGNVIIVPDAEAGERAVILDFGLVKQLESENSEELTQEGSFLGSPKYMSPEQIEHGDVDHRTDLYSLGVILFQCLAGRVPFDEPSSMKTLLAHVQKPIPALRERNPKVDAPPELEAVIRKLMAKSTNDRFLSAEELIGVLREVRSNLGLGGPATTSGSLPMRHGNESPTLTASGMPPASIAVEPSASLIASRQAVVEPAPQSRSPAIYVFGIVAIVAMFGIGAVVLRGPGRTQDNRSPTNAAAGNPEASRLTLTLESTPPGASVTERGTVLGVTPLRLALDPALQTPREFQLQLAGYQSTVFQQQPTRSDVHTSLALVALAAPPPAPAVPAVAPPPVAPPPAVPHAPPPAVRGGRVRNEPPPGGAVHTPPPPPPGEDIRTTR